MQIKNAKKWSPYSRRQSWLGTIALIFFAFAIRYLLQPVIAPYAVFHCFIVACLVIQYRYGYIYSAAGVVASILLGEYFFVKPYGTFNELAAKDVIISMNFALVIGAAIFFMEKLQRSVYERDLIMKALHSRQRISLYAENDRIFFSQKSSQAWSILEELLNEFDQILVIRYGDQDYKLEPALLKITQKWELIGQPSDWLGSVREDQREQMTQLMLQQKAKIGDPKEFALSLSDCQGHWHDVTASIDYYDFMGKPLSILRLVSV
jgi:K+-sensing histidine kinase KdpD